MHYSMHIANDANFKQRHAVQAHECASLSDIQSSGRRLVIIVRPVCKPHNGNMYMAVPRFKAERNEHCGWYVARTFFDVHVGVLSLLGTQPSMF